VCVFLTLLLANATYPPARSGKAILEKIAKKLRGPRQHCKRGKNER
jgi:hypothetical protein